MTLEQTLGLSIALLVMLVGLLGAFLPILPGTPLILLAAVGHKIYFGPTGAGWLTLAILGVLTLFSLVLDHLAAVYGARKLGATWRGALGAVLGAVVGLFFMPIGLLLGPFVGAVALEMLGGRDWRKSSQAGLGAVLGMLAGAVGKVACGVAMIGLFGLNVIYRIVQQTGTG